MSLAFTHLCGGSESLGKALGSGSSGRGGRRGYAGGEGGHHGAPRPLDTSQGGHSGLLLTDAEAVLISLVLTLMQFCGRNIVCWTLCVAGAFILQNLDVYSLKLGYLKKLDIKTESQLLFRVITQQEVL